MNASQLYIGADNGVMLCIDQIADHHEFSGRFYHSYCSSASSFTNIEELLFKMEALFNLLVLPYPSTNERHFNGEDGNSPVNTDIFNSISNRKKQTEKRKKIMKDEELLMQHGDLGSFIIRVQHRQNSSWQGRITWAEKNQTVYFRSVWEMMKLIENALDIVCPGETEPEPTWAGSIESDS